MVSGGFWHYLGSFMLYTLLAIGVIYLVFWYLKKNGNTWLLSGGKLLSGQKSIQSQKGPSVPGLSIESVLPLEARKNLYVIRTGEERFLIATSMENTQLLARLEKTPEAQAPSQAEVMSTLEGVSSSEETGEATGTQPPSALYGLHGLKKVLQQWVPLNKGTI